MNRIIHLRTLLIILAIFASSFHSNAQTELNKAKLQQLADSLEKEYVQSQKRIAAFLKKNNIPKVQTLPNGNIIVLVDIDKNGTPVFKGTYDNAIAAATTRVNALQNATTGFNLLGEGMIVGEWDGGSVRATHQEFQNIPSKIVQRDNVNTRSDHATHVAGTMVATGVSSRARGMAPLARLWAHDFNNDDFEMSARASEQLILSNHSYGTVSGWQQNGPTWTWYGDTTIGALEDHNFGIYNTDARSWDNIAFNAPNYLIVKSSGNNRSDIGPNVGVRYTLIRHNNRTSTVNRRRTSGYDCIPTSGNAKNILTVGAVNGVTNYINAASVVMSDFSSWGPADDGRIKPDVVGMGVNVFSSEAGSNTDYGTSSGTSMSAPNVTGSLLLVQEMYKRLNNNRVMRAATLKGLTIHTAREAGPNPGPDYMFGWGLVDALSMVEHLVASGNTVETLEKVLTNNQRFDTSFTVPANTPLKFTICWTDRSGIAVNTLDSRVPVLVNDLDMFLISPNGDTTRPWRLDVNNPAAAATRGMNNVDNVEQIMATATVAGNYRLVITHKRNLIGNSQAYSLLFSATSPNNAYGVFLSPTRNLNVDPAIGVEALWRTNLAYPVTITLMNNGVAIPSSTRIVNSGNTLTLNVSGVPAGNNYQLRLSNISGQNFLSNPFSIAVTPALTLADFTPKAGFINTIVSITGQSLNSVDTVRIGGTFVPFTAFSNNEIRLTINNPVNGIVELSNPAGQVARSTQPFTMRSNIRFCNGNIEVITVPRVDNAMQNLPLLQGKAYLIKMPVERNETYFFNTCHPSVSTQATIYGANGSVLFNVPRNASVCTGFGVTGSYLNLAQDTLYMYITGASCMNTEGNTILNYRKLASSSTPVVINQVFPLQVNFNDFVFVRGRGFLNGVQSAQLAVSTNNSRSVTYEILNDSLLRFRAPSEIYGPANFRAWTGTSFISSVERVSVLNPFNFNFCGNIQTVELVETGTINWNNFQNDTIPIPVPATSRLAYLYRFYAQQGDTVVFNTCGSNDDTQLRIFNSQRVEVAQVDDNGPLCNGTASSMRHIVASSDTFTLVVQVFRCGQQNNPIFLRANINRRANRNLLLSSFSPSKGVEGTEVRLRGIGLSQTGTVQLRAPIGNNTIVTSLSFRIEGNDVIATIPNNINQTITSGFFRVRNSSDSSTNTQLFRLIPAFRSVSDREIIQGDSITITGRRFSNSLLAMFGNSFVPVRFINDTSVVVRFPFSNMGSHQVRLIFPLDTVKTDVVSMCPTVAPEPLRITSIGKGTLCDLNDSVTLSVNTDFPVQWSTGATSKTIVIRNPSSVNVGYLTSGECGFLFSAPRTSFFINRIIYPQVNLSISGNNFIVTGADMGASPRFLWFINDSLFITSGAPTWPIENGSGVYKVRVSYPNGCSRTTAGLLVSSPELLSSTKSITLMPNPTKGVFAINYNGFEDSYKVEIFAANGKLLSVIPNYNNNVSINLDNMISGIYLVRISTAENTFTKKLVLTDD